MKILVVDDSKAMGMIVIRSLKSTGYANASILEATNGTEALGVIRSEQPDLVLSDWNMPETNGIELLETLSSEGSPVKFGFVTSESTPEMRERAQAAGALFLVSKPFTPESLERAVAKVV
jgi:two-component system, chemotaxis family, chemotaxis protein CheY